MQQRCRVHDLVTLSRRVIDERTHYMTAPATIGRTGIQSYTRAELGLDGDPNAIVRLMRTPEEVFRPETIKSFENVPITDGHPPDGVNADNWARVAKGEVRDIGKQDGDLLGGNAIVKDGQMVAKAASGKSALSCGYDFVLDLTPGPGFDGYQREILGNHVAIVDVPRGGPICRLGDENNRKDNHMSTRKIAVDGLPRFEIDELAAEAIEQHIKTLAADRDAVIKDFSDATDSHKTKLAAKDTEISTLKTAATAKDTEIAGLKEKLAKAQAVDVDALVAERSQVTDEAKKIAPDVAPKGSAMDIRKAAIVVACADETNKTVVDAIFGGQPIDKATDAQIKGAFATLLALPRQAALDAQSEAVGRALGVGTSANVITGSVERL